MNWAEQDDKKKKKSFSFIFAFHRRQSSPYLLCCLVIHLLTTFGVGGCCKQYWFKAWPIRYFMQNLNIEQRDKRQNGVPLYSGMECPYTPLLRASLALHLRNPRFFAVPWYVAILSKAVCSKARTDQPLGDLDSEMIAPLYDVSDKSPPSLWHLLFKNHYSGIINFKVSLNTNAAKLYSSN